MTAQAENQSLVSAGRAGALEIRSFQQVFDVERRIYRVDRLRLNPAGVPVRGVAYVAVCAVAIVALTRVPCVGFPLAALPWAIRDVGLPVILGSAAAIVRIDGRCFHHAAVAAIRFAASSRVRGARGPAARCGSSGSPPELLLIADGSEAAFRRARFRGPGAALVGREHRLSVDRSRVGGSPRRIVVAPAAGGRALARPRVVEVGRGQVLAVRSIVSAPDRHARRPSA